MRTKTYFKLRSTPFLGKEKQLKIKSKKENDSKKRVEKKSTEITANNAMPSGSMPLIKLLLYMLSNILLYVMLLKRLIQNKNPNFNTKKQKEGNPRWEQRM